MRPIYPFDSITAENFEWWCVQFQISEDELQSAVTAAGSKPCDVERWLLTHRFGLGRVSIFVKEMLDILPTRMLQHNSLHRRTQRVENIIADQIRVFWFFKA